jgi:C4-type Zn-finger protein
MSSPKEQQPSQEPTKDDERRCPICQIGVMELIDAHYDLELEDAYMVPVKVVTYACTHCHYEEHEEGWE